MLDGEMTTANGPYDFTVIMNEWPVLIPAVFAAFDEDRVFDVFIREKLIDIAHGRYRPVGPKSYNLERLVKIYLKIQLDKDTYRMRYGELYHIPLDRWPAGARKYALDDAIYTLQVHDEQEPRGQEEDIFCDQHPQVRAAQALHLMSAWGVRTKASDVEKLRIKTQLRYDELRERMVASGMIQANGAKAQKRARQMIFEALGERCKLTKTGFEKVRKKELTKLQALEKLYVSIDEDSCLISDIPELIDYTNFVSTEKLLSTYVSAVVKGVDRPIHAYYEVLVATGRTSCSGPNMQNPPKAPGVRECFEPRPGNVFVFCDYNCAELHALAQVCMAVFGYSMMAEALNAGKDLHVVIGAELMGIDYEHAMRLKKTKSKEEFNGLTIGKARQLAKVVNFGAAGGMGAASLCDYAKASYGVTITLDEAKTLKKTWLTMFAELVEYFNWINSQMRSAKDKDGEDVKRSWIEHYKSGRKRGKCAYTVTANSYFQGLTADGAKAAMWEITRRQWLEPTSALYGTRLAMFIHDEFALECPEEHAVAAAEELSIVMCEEYNKFTPDVPVGAEALICRKWRKSNEPTYNEDGVLIPCEDAPDFREAA